MADSLVITEEDLGLRLDKLLSQKFPEHSRSYFQYLINEEFVLLNGHPVKKQLRPETGDKIVIDFQKPPLLDVKPEPIPLDILYEDEELLVINKPRNMVVHPAPGAYTGTFANALLHHCKQLDPKHFEDLRPGIVHRIDKDTTGALLAAKTIASHQKLTAQFSARSVKKHYLAICSSKPPEGEFSAPLRRHPIKRKQMTVHPEGKEAISAFRVLAHKENLSLVEIELITGRTHQIRAHLKKLNCPILGDPIYGSVTLNRKYRIHQQLLHAHRIHFIHPISGDPVELTAPIPSEMKDFIDLIQCS
ncbi:MAG: Ribosomal large subunit pseudouridine synthase D [Chlamydiae bacterium]|nr:Ribosomal large subunit pseudouridine synthase D [Chlamydiota bacterium]